MRTLTVCSALLSAILAIGTAAGADATRARLMQLKQWYEDGLVPQAIYEDEIRRTLRNGVGPRADTAARDDDTPVAWDFAVPNMDWGEFETYFEITNLRTGDYAYHELKSDPRERPNGSDRTGDILHAPAVVCDVKARRQFAMDIADFSFTDFEEVPELIRRGEEAARIALPEILRLQEKIN